MKPAASRQKTFHLKAVEYSGKRYANCQLVLDLEALKAEIKRPGILGRGMVPLADLTWGKGTTVQVEGAVVRSGPVTFIAEDDRAAGEISLALQGRTAGAEEIAGRLSALRDHTLAFLRLRAEGTAYLVELKNDPRQALVDKSASFTGRYENPALEYLMSYASTLAEAHAKMTYAAADVQERAGTQAIEKVFAFVSAVGYLQDSYVAGTGFAAELGDFMLELGMDAAVIGDADVKAATESLIGRSEPIFAAPSLPT